jgi:hypothetical protein
MPVVAFVMLAGVMVGWVALRVGVPATIGVVGGALGAELREILGYQLSSPSRRTHSRLRDPARCGIPLPAVLEEGEHDRDQRQDRRDVSDHDRSDVIIALGRGGFPTSLGARRWDLPRRGIKPTISPWSTHGSFPPSVRNASGRGALPPIAP